MVKSNLTVLHGLFTNLLVTLNIFAVALLWYLHRDPILSLSTYSEMMPWHPTAQVSEEKGTGLGQPDIAELLSVFQSRGLAGKLSFSSIRR